MMNINGTINRSNKFALMSAALTGLLLGGFAATAQAEEAASSGVDVPTPDQGSAGQAAPQAPATYGDYDWHVNGTLYLFLPGVHGNLNAFDHNLGFKASPGDLLSHANFAVMGVLGLQYKRLVVISDLIYAPLTADKTKVFDRLPNTQQLSAEVKYTQFMLAPEVGYRLINNERVKIDGLAGFRYWHQGTTLTLTPQPAAFTNNYTAKNWVDPVFGARIQVPLSPKLLATIWGDAGGFGAGAQLDYQVTGALTYAFNAKWSLNAAWRYLYVDYSSGNFSSQTAQSGIAIGVTYKIK